MLGYMRISKNVAPWLLLVLLLIGSSSAYAFDIPTGSDDVSLRWDNSLRYTLMNRVAPQNQSILNSPNGDDGDRNFKKGIVSNRLDILSEADLVYKSSYGVRVSGAFWYDQAYHNNFDNDSVGTSNVLNANGRQTVNRLSENAKNYYAGPAGELLDAFIFGKIEAGPVPVYLKLGRHVYSWGQGLINPIHAISYGQMPLDFQKGIAQPGVEAKEIFRPTNMASAIAQITPEFQIAGQYYLQWERNRLPLEGTYFGSSDVALDGDGVLIAGPGAFIHHGRDIEAARNRDFGLAAQWSPQFLNDATFGFYYRKFSDRMPQLIINLNGDPGTNPNNWLYHAAFKSDIDLYGISYATKVLDLSVGAELSYRQHMPLVSNPATIFNSTALPDNGHILGAYGDTMHGVINVFGLLKKSPVWDTGNWLFEFNYSRWLNVESDPQRTFKGDESYTGFDKVTKDAGTVNLVFTPQYLQILPGLDLDVPLSVTYGLWGVSAVSGGGGKGDGTWGIGLNFTYLTRYKLNFNYVSYFGQLEDSPAGAVARGPYALYKDRDFVSMTFKVTF